MSKLVAEIEEKIRALSSEEKGALLRSLIADLDDAEEADTERAWIEEAERRYQQVADGEVTPVPAEQVFAHLRARLNG